jgi:uncharacterized BrkB/YihY/UPF0761 family membrane protein
MFPFVCLVLGAIVVLLAGSALLVDSWSSIEHAYRRARYNPTAERRVDLAVYVALWLALFVVIGLAFSVLVYLAAGMKP